MKAEINKMKDDGQLEEFVMERIDKNIANLLKWNVICMEEEKIYLNERSLGKDSIAYEQRKGGCWLKDFVSFIKNYANKRFYLFFLRNINRTI